MANAGAVEAPKNGLIMRLPGATRFALANRRH
jgi:hypothetical protein